MDESDRKIFVGGLSYSTDDEKLKEYFENFGSVLDSIVMRDRLSRRSRGFGFVTFHDYEALEEALANQDHIIDSRRVEAKLATPRSESFHEDNVSTEFDLNSRSHAADELVTKKLFIGGLHYETKPDDLRRYFEEYGRVLSSEVMFNRETGKSRGFGFIIFDDEYSVRLAMDDDEHVINGKNVEVKAAIAKSKLTSSDSGSTPPSSPSTSSRQSRSNSMSSCNTSTSRSRVMSSASSTSAPSTRSPSITSYAQALQYGAIMNSPPNSIRSLGSTLLRSQSEQVSTTSAAQQQQQQLVNESNTNNANSSSNNMTDTYGWSLYQPSPTQLSLAASSTLLSTMEQQHLQLPQQQQQQQEPSLSSNVDDYSTDVNAGATTTYNSNEYLMPVPHHHQQQQQTQYQHLNLQQPQMESNTLPSQTAASYSNNNNNNNSPASFLPSSLSTSTNDTDTKKRIGVIGEGRRKVATTTTTTTTVTTNPTPTVAYSTGFSNQMMYHQTNQIDPSSYGYSCSIFSDDNSFFSQPITAPASSTIPAISNCNSYPLLSSQSQSQDIHYNYSPAVPSTYDDNEDNDNSNNNVELTSMYSYPLFRPSSFFPDALSSPINRPTTPDPGLAHELSVQSLPPLMNAYQSNNHYHPNGMFYDSPNRSYYPGTTTASQQYFSPDRSSMNYFQLQHQQQQQQQQQYSSPQSNTSSHYGSPGEFSLLNSSHNDYDNNNNFQYHHSYMYNNSNSEFGIITSAQT